MKEKIKKIYSLSLKLLILFLFSFSFADASTLKMFSDSSVYNIGDIIKVKVFIDSEEQINAISGKISFPTDKLFLENISKDYSIVDLWVKEPNYSNDVGQINFDGVILKSFSGYNGEVLDINFIAKNNGNLDLDFLPSYIFLNDGNGTEKLLNSKKLSFNINENKINNEIQVKKNSGQIIEVNRSILAEASRNLYNQQKELTEKNINKTDYFMVLGIIFMIVLVLMLFIVYSIHHHKFVKDSSKKNNV